MKEGAWEVESEGDGGVCTSGLHKRLAQAACTSGLHKRLPARRLLLQTSPHLLHPEVVVQGHHPAPGLHQQVLDGLRHDALWVDWVGGWVLGKRVG